MADLRLSKRVRTVIRLSPTSAGGVVPETLYERASHRKSKKSSALLKPAQRLVKRLAEAQHATAVRYLERHKRSNETRRDGWLLDFPSNVARAGRAGQKALKVRRLLLG
jgi:hypothetical protein